MTFSAPSEERFHPQRIEIGAQKVSLVSGNNVFAFRIRPGLFYSSILNTNTHHHLFRSRGAPAVVNAGYTGNRFQSESYGIALPDYGLFPNDSPGKSSFSFFASPSYFSGEYWNYLHVFSWTRVPVAWIKILALPQKIFSSPFRGISQYYNAFGHRAVIYNRRTPTRFGHDGVDIQPVSRGNNGLQVDLGQSVVPVADGRVTRIGSFGSLGKAVWITHEKGGKTHTSLSMHLQQSFVSVGQLVQRGVTPLGFVDSEQEHLHLEIFPFATTSWNWGYSNGRGGQRDPLKILFEQ